jgi:hypothetical protein
LFIPFDGGPEREDVAAFRPGMFCAGLRGFPAEGSSASGNRIFDVVYDTFCGRRSATSSE